MFITLQLAAPTERKELFQYFREGTLIQILEERSGKPTEIRVFQPHPDITPMPLTERIH